ncbi:MAG: 4Fe-4S dicluster domain-containing protein [Syntrophomonadaceae bacterium]|nr:4Fe-4S dicluster domain-containing protein [Syntrophomonadaceae bacterium]
MSMSRRSFIKRAAFSGMAVTAVLSGADVAAASINSGNEFASIINLTKCDGCKNFGTPSCVAACRSKNQNRFPQAQKPIGDYWPQTKHEDWSEKQELSNRLTPYNWTYVQHLQVEHEGQEYEIHVPRRCLHCDNPPCASLCPFGVNEKMPEGPVLINPNGCFGGAKCRDVCPWEIPQRQGGVGLYLQVAPKYAGGGVMYKCDMCYDLIQKGQQPACVSACPNNALIFGLKGDMHDYARQWAQENSGYLYGLEEHGGTSTIYLSAVPFEAIHDAILNQEIDGKPGKPAMPVGVGNILDEPAGMAQGFLIAPVAGLLGAGLSVYKIMTGADNDENNEA